MVGRDIQCELNSASFGVEVTRRFQKENEGVERRNKWGMSRGLSRVRDVEIYKKLEEWSV